MKRKIYFRLILILIIFLSLPKANGQSNEENEVIIHLMRAKQFYGSGAKMDLMINGNLFHKIKNGNRLIIKTTRCDTLNLQIVYPPIKGNKSKILQVIPEDESEFYIDLFYWGEGYNPLKHSGVLNPTGGKPDFNIEILQMEKSEGKMKFLNAEYYKDNKKITVLQYQN